MACEPHAQAPNLECGADGRGKAAGSRGRAGDCTGQDGGRTRCMRGTGISRGRLGRGAPRLEIELHKGAAPRPRSMGGGSRPAAPPPPSTAAAALWEAAGDALAWTASMRGHAAWTEGARGWEDRIEADEAVKEAALECGDAIDAKDGVDGDAMARALGTMGRVRSTLARAAEAFGRSSRLHRESEAGQAGAALAYARAGLPMRAEAADRRAAESHRHAQAAARLATGALGGAKALARNAGRMEARTAALSESAWRKRVGDLDELSLIQADMWDDARQAGAQSAEMARRSEDAGRLAAEVQRMAGDAAERSSARAEDEAAGSRGGDPGMQDAAEAWRSAAAEAKRTAEEMQDRQRQSAGGGRRG